MSAQADWLQESQLAREPVPPVLSEVIREPSILAAIQYAQKCAAKENKQIYGPLGWSAEVWSRIFNPEAKNPVFFDVRRLERFMDLTNDAPLMWLAHRRRWDWATIRPYHSPLEAENARLRAENAELKRQREIEINYQRELAKAGR